MRVEPSWMQLVPLQKRPREFLHPFHHWGHIEKTLCRSRSWALSRHKIWWCRDLGLPWLQSCGKYISPVHRLLGLLYFVIAAWTDWDVPLLLWGSQGTPGTLVNGGRWHLFQPSGKSRISFLRLTEWTEQTPHFPGKEKQDYWQVPGIGRWKPAAEASVSANLLYLTSLDSCSGW